MISSFRNCLFLIFISAFIYTQDLAPMLGKPFLSSINSKKETVSFLFSLNNSYQFSQTVSSSCENNISCEKKYSNISASILLKSGFELVSGKYMSNNNGKLAYTGMAYHIKKRKFGIGLHFTSYKHELINFYTSKPRETGISLHLRFRKSMVKPYIYYSRALMYNDTQPLEFFVFGATTRLNNFVFSTFVNTYIENNFNINTENAQMNITIGVLLD